ncbi:MAG: formylglycine-generating enzyme family protein [Thermoguttaceae bacterium]|nr:formylglycine-generating enzyme family protein [Thermoguttaceae bacterium]
MRNLNGSWIISVLCGIVAAMAVSFFAPVCLAGDEILAGKRLVKVINGVEFAFRWCPAGTFMMGAPMSETGRSDEKQHKVTLTKGFWMLETEVTQKQWKAVMRNNPSRFKGDDLPVECVSLGDCQEFCKKCTQLGLPVQLPTEAQWEYACRAGSTGAYAGNLDDMVWYWDNSDRKTHPVGTKKPNAWGLYDMHGNVWEWCQDWYDDYPRGSVTDPVGPSSGSDRVFRGGCWLDSAGFCRSAYRFYIDPGYRDYTLGFRCVKGQ